MSSRRIFNLEYETYDRFWHFTYFKFTGIYRIDERIEVKLLIYNSLSINLNVELKASETDFFFHVHVRS